MVQGLNLCWLYARQAPYPCLSSVYFYADCYTQTKHIISNISSSISHYTPLILWDILIRPRKYCGLISAGGFIISKTLKHDREGVLDVLYS